MVAPSKAPVATPWVRWRGFIHQTGLPPLWLLTFLFAGAIGVEVLRAQGRLAPLGVAACVFAVACAGAALAGHERGERALLILPCFWIIGSVVLGVLAFQQWYESSPNDKDFHAWLRDTLLDVDWSLQGLFLGGLGGRSSFWNLLMVPMLTVPGVLFFAVIRKLRAAERLPWELPPATATRFSFFLIGAYAWVGYGFLPSLLTLIPLLIRSDNTIHQEWEKSVRWVLLVGAALFGLVLALYALSKLHSLSYDTGGAFASAQRRVWGNRFIFGWCVLQLLLLIPTLWGSRAARAVALGLSLLPAPLGVATALTSGLGEHWVLIKLSGFSALALAYLPLSRLRKSWATPSPAASV